jgi:maltose alpha-D-glucosyltransferase/alpha-amylase
MIEQPIGHLETDVRILTSVAAQLESEAQALTTKIHHLRGAIEELAKEVADLTTCVEKRGPTAQPFSQFATLVMSDDARMALEGRDRRQLERDALPDFLRRQRWFAAKNAAIESVQIHPLASLPGDGAEHQLTLTEVALRNGRSQYYFLPLSVRWGGDQLGRGAPKLSYTVAKVRRGSRVGALTDGAYDEAFAHALIAAMKSGRSVRTRDGEIRFSSTAALGALEDLGVPRLADAEQSNVSLVCGDRVVLKIYRRLRRGIQPELEIGRFLTETGRFQSTPAFLGAVEHVPEDGEATALAAAFSFVSSEGDGWSVITDALGRLLKEQALVSPPVQPFLFPLDLGATLGRRTAGLHRALAIDTSNPAFAPEPITNKDIALWVDRVRTVAEHAFAALEAASRRDSAAVAAEIERLKARRDDVFQTLQAIACIPPAGAKTRIHGDYHLGQVLVTKADVVITDFEGEPQRSLVERREKASPLRDVADMLRSFDYATKAAVDRHAPLGTNSESRARAVAIGWRDHASRDFLSAYVEAMKGAPNYPDNEATAAGLLDLFLLKKAFYEISYEAAYRPDWLSIPVRGVLDLLERREALVTRDGSSAFRAL